MTLFLVDNMCPTITDPAYEHEADILSESLKLLEQFLSRLTPLVLTVADNVSLLCSSSNAAPTEEWRKCPIEKHDWLVFVILIIYYA